jgi:hypothetical protein
MVLPRAEEGTMTGSNFEPSQMDAKPCNRVQTRAKAHRFVTLRCASNWQPEDFRRAHVLPENGAGAGVGGGCGGREARPEAGPHVYKC